MVNFRKKSSIVPIFLVFLRLEIKSNINID